MKMLLDEELVEAVTLLCASGKRSETPAAQIRRFYRERDKLYSILDPEERNNAFFRLHLEWFREWGQEELLKRALMAFPLLEDNLKVLVFRKARSGSEEGSELYVNPVTGRNGVVTLRAEKFQEEASLARFLSHELMHLNDMVDPAFGYAPALGGMAFTGPQQRLVRDRYRLLWDVTIDGRLTRSGRLHGADQQHRRGEFDQAYSFLAEEKRRETFDSLWCGALSSHEEIMALATNPRYLKCAQAPLPGGTCPSCGFPTFDWADCRTLIGATASIIQKQNPDWTPEIGICRRCVETFEAAVKCRPPSTIILGSA